MTLYIGVDFHPHQQTVAWCDTETGEIQTRTLFHEPINVRNFYQSLKPGIVGLEASCKAVWFENLLAETNHQLRVGNPVLIRRRATSRHKSDKRDAELILDLLMKDEFPAIWQRTRANSEVLEILKLRHSLVRQRTQISNRMQSLAKSCGLKKGRMKTEFFRQLLREAAVDEAGALQRSQLFRTLENLSEQISELEAWLRERVTTDTRVQLLMTQKGVGYLTALAVVNSLSEITRFDRPTKQVPAYLGMEPLERESAGRRQKGGISRAGSSLTRFLLGQSAQIAARSDERLKSFYNRLAKRKPKGVAKTATARKLLVKLVIMLRDEISAEEFDRRGGTAGDTRKVDGLKGPNL